MKTNDIFNLSRFIRLFKQNLIHNYRMILISIISVSGGIFILLLLNQLANRFRPWMYGQFMSLFLFLFIALGIVFIGTSFPGLRSREKSYSYLLTPASSLEKFLFEFISRPLLFIVTMPLIYWIIYTVEGKIMHILNPDFIFTSFWFFRAESINIPSDIRFWVIALLVNAGIFFFIIPFTGAASFMKHPLLKTYFSFAIFFFLNLFVVYFFMEILGFKEHISGHQDGFLFMDSKESMIKFFTFYLIIVNLATLSVAYFKLKEKEA